MCSTNLSTATSIISSTFLPKDPTGKSDSTSNLKVFLSIDLKAVLSSFTSLAKVFSLISPSSVIFCRNLLSRKFSKNLFLNPARFPFNILSVANTCCCTSAKNALAKRVPLSYFLFNTLSVSCITFIAGDFCNAAKVLFAVFSLSNTFISEATMLCISKDVVGALS